MSLAEALSAATINAAHSLGRGATHGSIEVGKVPQGNIFFVHKFSLENVFFCPNF
jgi:cytosine/adenosine deaminase-related metal-dependent hydrolase